MSSVLEVKNLEGDYTHRKGFAELSLTTFEFFTEGPIVKDKSSYLFGIRRTYYDLAMNLIYRDKYKNIAFPYFYDAQSKFVWKLTDKDKLSLNTIISYEGMDLKMSDLGQDNMGEDKEVEVHYKEFQMLPAINWERIQNDRLSFNFTLSSLSNYGNFNFSTSEVSARSKELSKDFYLRNKIIFLANNHTIEQGLYFSRTWLDVNTRDKNRVLMPNGTYYYDEKNINFDRTRLGTGGIYLQDDWELIKDKVFFNFGGLYEYFDYTKDTTFCPRGGIKYALTETTTLKFNTGLYSQFPVNEKYEAKDGEPPFFRNKNIKSEKAIHYIVGLEQELPKHFFFRLETYLKNYYHRIVRDPDPDLVFANNGKRRAWGVDLFLQRKISEKWDGWLAYSYLSAKDKILKRNNPADYPGQSGLDYLNPVNEWFPFDKERKHNFSLVFNYEINSRYKLAVTSRFSTGMPYTDVAGATAYGQVYVPAYGEYLGARLPNYERIDVKLSMPFFRIKNTECFLQIINLLNSTNVNGYYYSDDYAQKESEKMLPFIPIFGVKYIF